MALRRRLRRTGIPVQEVNIWEDPDAAARVRGAADGNETVPTVFVGQQALVNPGVKQVEALVRRAAPHLIDDSHPKPVRRRIWPFR